MFFWGQSVLLTHTERSEMSNMRMIVMIFVCVFHQKCSDTEKRTQREEYQHLRAYERVLEEVFAVQSKGNKNKRFIGELMSMPISYLHWGSNFGHFILIETFDNLEEWVREIFIKIPNKCICLTVLFLLTSILTRVYFNVIYFLLFSQWPATGRFFRPLGSI